MVPGANEPGEDQMSMENGIVANGAGRRVEKSPNVLVVFCDALYRMDYTFLQVCNLNRRSR